MKKNFTILLTLTCLLLFACSKKDNQLIQSNTKSITKFVFTKADNPSLTEDVEGVISGNQIKVVLYGTDKNNLKPTITYQAGSISPSSNSFQDFTNPVSYKLTAEDGSTSNYMVTVDVRDLYIAGYEYNNSGVQVAVYWKNGNKIVLGDGITASSAESLALIGNDVYVAGSVRKSDGVNTAVYWKNGNKIVLNNDPNKHSYAFSMAVSGSDVYIGGVVDNLTPCYWKNNANTITKLDASANYSASMLAVGNDVYMGGSIYTKSNNEIPVYWKNGVMVALRDIASDGHGYVYGMAMTENDFYAAGEDKGMATYWKNGIKTELGKGAAWGISISGNDVYLAGNSAEGPNNVAVYWKNGNKVALTDGTNPAVALRIAAIGSDTYVIGYETKNGISIQTCWINGKPKIISERRSFAKYIVVKS